MKLYDENRNLVGEMEKPGPIEWHSNWYEAGESYWIMRPIPRATPEQLAAIGMRERDGRPVECKERETIWIGGVAIQLWKSPHSGKFRFVLVPREPPKPPVEKTCETCGKEKCIYSDEERKKEHSIGLVGCERGWTPKPPVEKHYTCDGCMDCSKCVQSDGERAHWTPKPPMEAAHTSCAGCKDQNSMEDLAQCDLCFGGDILESHIRKNYTSAPTREQGFTNE